MKSTRQTKAHSRIALTIAAILLAGMGTGCEDPFDFLFTFDRELPLARGAIFGTVVREDIGGDVAPYAQVNMMGTGLVRQGNDQGQVVLADLGAGTYVLRINDDVDGDGQPERSRLVSASMVVSSRPDSLGFGAGDQLVSVSLGEIIVAGSGEVSGEVKVDDGTGQMVAPSEVNLVGRALLFRTLDVTTDASGPAFQLGADAETHVDDEGRYRFNQALAGDLSVVVTLHNVTGGVRGETVYVSAPAELALENLGTVVAPAVEVPAIDPTLETLVRPLEISVTPTLEDRGTPYAIFVPPGRVVSTCQDSRPGTPQFAYERIVDATAASLTRLNNAPLGVWDVRFCGEARFVDAETGQLEGEAELGTATLYNLVIPPSEDGVSTILAGPLVLSRELDGCIRRICPDGALDCSDDEKELVRDCDGDNIQGLPPYDVTDPTSASLYSACASTCGAKVGVESGGDTCTVGDAVYDCDDDGDLQSDTSEPPQCYGPGLGDDRDGDGICTGADTFPSCAANTAEECEAGRVDTNPVIPEEFGGFGEDRDAGVFLPEDGGVARDDAGVVGEGDAGVAPPSLGVFDPTFNGDGVTVSEPVVGNNLEVVMATGHTDASFTVVANAKTANVTTVITFDETGVFTGEALFPGQTVRDFTMTAFDSNGVNHYFGGTYFEPGLNATGVVVCRLRDNGAALVADATYGIAGDGCVTVEDPVAADPFLLSGLAVNPLNSEVYLTGTGPIIVPDNQSPYLKFAKVLGDGTPLTPDFVFDQNLALGPYLADPIEADVRGTTVMGVDDDVGQPRNVIVTSGTIRSAIQDRAWAAYIEVDGFGVQALQVFEMSNTPALNNQVTGQAKDPGDNPRVLVLGTGQVDPDGDPNFLATITVASTTLGGTSIFVEGASGFDGVDAFQIVGDIPYILGAQRNDSAELQPQIWDFSDTARPILATVPVPAFAGYNATSQFLFQSGATLFVAGEMTHPVLSPEEEPGLVFIGRLFDQNVP